MLNLDTHILLFMFNDELTPKENQLIQSQDEKMCISSIVLWELAMLQSKKGITFDFGSHEWRSFSKNLQILPITQEIAIQSCNLDFQSDPADEIIAATSIVHNVPLLTRDRDILKSKMVPLIS